ncbi:MAG: Flp pilus assembly protein CpaB [Sandarakinorhabdus sp.]|nr:Flp pilus assembly protein CpaB [Sandarakinorhabdus sp.]
MRRSSIVMLLAAILLGLAAVFFARFFLMKTADTASTNVRTVSAVVAAQPFQFGEKITAEKLKVVEWPANGLPPGTFQRIADAVGTDAHVALRAIDANELITEKSISGKDARLSASPLLGATMRAVSVPVGEASGAGGFVAPGDRVDVYVTHGANGDDLPYTDQLMQDVRVLAVGLDSNVGKDKPEVVKTATLEVTPIQAQRVALAQTVGQISLSLRSLVDESRIRLETAQVADLTDGTVSRKLSKPKSYASNDGQPAAPSARGPAQPAQAFKPAGPSIEIYRGTKPTTYALPSGS